MFEFTDKFDTLENDKLILKITQKYIGDNEMIPFYYYDIIRKTDSVTVGQSVEKPHLNRKEEDGV